MFRKKVSAAASSNSKTNAAATDATGSGTVSGFIGDLTFATHGATIFYGSANGRGKGLERRTANALYLLDKDEVETEAYVLYPGMKFCEAILHAARDGCKVTLEWSLSDGGDRVVDTLRVHYSNRRPNI